VCQALPRLILRVEGSRAQVDCDGSPLWVEAAHLDDLRAGEFVIVYAGQALERVDQAEAEELLQWFAALAADQPL
jgi:hydrogenase expression/formation protein HypC